VRPREGTLAQLTAPGHPPGDYINGRFEELPARGTGGRAVTSVDPASPGRVIWSAAPVPDHVEAAVEAARCAFRGWSRAPMDDRIALLRRWQAVTSEHAGDLAGLITDEMGKTLAESLIEAKALAEKVEITLSDISLSRVRGYDVEVSKTRIGRCRFKPHGVMAVIAPYNFPAHLANGHFVPALLLGNTIVLKPSEKTPATGQMLAEMMDAIGCPPGVFNVVQGGGDIAVKLVNHEAVDGILFTGSWPVGRRILEANLDRPGRIIALEMGGNNPAVVLDDAHLKQAVVECVRSAFATTGQRCTCTRRIIVQRRIAGRFVPAFCAAASTLLIGPGRSEAPVFMGPLVNEPAVEVVLRFQREQAARGGRVLLEAARPAKEGAFITPGVIEVNRFSLEDDAEVFGPLVRVAVVEDLDEAIEQANASRYGLAASIFTASREAAEQFFARVNSGCINWNTGTAGASSRLPFGGWGRSGNHRPAAAFSVDSCAYPIANMVEQSADVAIPGGMMWDDRWIR
jgi:succinylglutamic semialdehyde dehydrogenase